jgi:crotonobetainyl-CoA:carnitine CoA-transferase CaiB-like acyl-CoA transferase
MSRAGVLDGIRVVEVATFVLGPAAGTVMVDFGADVVHVEHPVLGDAYRMLRHLKPLPRCDRNYPWILTSRGKRSIAIDLRGDAGRAVLYDLVAGADVFITNYHPSVLEALRIRWQDLAPRNERLVYAHATGYGDAGPEVEKPGYDATAWWARSGLMEAVRPDEAEFGLATPGMGDQPSAIALLGGIALALYERERTGRGQRVSTSLLGNGAWANGLYLQAALCGADPYVAPTHATSPNALVNHYRCADGRALYLAMVQETTEWEAFTRAIARPELLGDERFASLEARRAHAAELVRLLDAVFAAEPLEHWRKVLDLHAVTFGIVARTPDLPDDEQMIANGIFPKIEGDPEGLRTVDSPIHLDGSAKRPPGPAPAIGQHTRELLAELGYPQERIEALVAAGTVRAEAP